MNLLDATSRTSQGQRRIQEYANDLLKLWRELDLCRPPTPESLDREYILQDIVFFFLLGLNLEFEV